MDEMEKSCLVFSATHVTGGQSYICVKSHPLDFVLRFSPEALNNFIHIVHRLV